MFGDTLKAGTRKPTPYYLLYNMDVTTLLWTSFVSLVGLQLCVPDGSVEKMADTTDIMSFQWCPNPFIRFAYGLCQLLGCCFVLFAGIALTITEHWWYVLVYLVGIIIAKIATIFVLMPLSLVDIEHWFNDPFFGSLQAKRLVGSIIIILGIFSFLFQL